MFLIYQLLFTLLLPIYLLFFCPYRCQQLRELPSRIPERLGFKMPTIASKKQVIWCHGVSNGEAMSLMPFVKDVQQQQPNAEIIFSCNTLTATRLIKQHLPEVTQVMAPLDHYLIWRRVLKKTRPKYIFISDSELWPGMFMVAKHLQIPIYLISARISDFSCRIWLKWPFSNLMASTISAIYEVHPQGQDDRTRFSKLLALSKHQAAMQTDLNLKLVANNKEAIVSSAKLAASQLKRPIWLAASSHPTEEQIIFKAHQQIIKQYPELLTVLVPRHTIRSDEIVSLAKKFAIPLAIRSKGEKLTMQHQLYLADTTGELPEFYAQINLSLVCGSFKKMGGHNIAEAIINNSLPIVGPHNFNFDFLTLPLISQKLIDQVANATELAQRVCYWLSNPEQLSKQQEQTKKWLNHQQQQQQLHLAKLVQKLA